MMSRRSISDPTVGRGAPIWEYSTGLPPGYRFHPTDDELVNYYLIRKVLNRQVELQVIGEVDFNKCEPWDLPGRNKYGNGIFYFYSYRDRKYPTGMRTNRATEAGYWKATGKDREITNSGRVVGLKKTLVFYMGRAPKGTKTNWIMHEYRLEDDAIVADPQQQGWVVCRVFEKDADGKSISLPAAETSEFELHDDGETSLRVDMLQMSNYANPANATDERPLVQGIRPSQVGDSIDNFVATWDADSLDYIWGVSPAGHGP